MHRIIFTGSSDLVSRILFFLMLPVLYSVWSAVCFILCIFISCLIHPFFCGTESPAFLSAGGSVSSSDFQLLFPVHSFLILLLNLRYRFCIFLHALYRKSFDPSDHFSIRIFQLRGTPFLFSGTFPCCVNRHSASDADLSVCIKDLSGTSVDFNVFSDEPLPIFLFLVRRDLFLFFGDFTIP